MSLFPSWLGRNPTPPGLRRGGDRIAAGYMMILERMTRAHQSAAADPPKAGWPVRVSDSHFNAGNDGRKRLGRDGCRRVQGDNLVNANQTIRDCSIGDQQTCKQNGRTRRRENNKPRVPLHLLAYTPPMR